MKLYNHFICVLYVLMKYNIICECCWNKVTAYSHRFNLWLIQAFDKLCKHRERNRRPVKIWKDIELTKVQYCNFQKLAYRWITEHSTHWREPTQKWLRYRQWLEPIFNMVWTLWKQVLTYDHPAWLTHKIQPIKRYIREEKSFEYKKRENYAQERNTTATLFPQLLD